MKIYAKQVPPEYQESPLFMEGWPENVFVFGNRSFNNHSGRLEDIKQALEDISDVCNGYGYTKNLLDVIPARDDGREYTRHERQQLARLAQNYTEYGSGSSDENELLCDVLELITGQKYEYATIRGCCQGDWQDIIYPAEYGREWLQCFEMEYFNTGTEWTVDVDGCNVSVYTHSWNERGHRDEIADTVGVDPGDVILYTFTGWSRTPQYMEV